MGAGVNYLKPSFSVNPSDAKAPKDCRHGWIDWKRSRCVLCGVAMVAWSGAADFNEWETPSGAEVSVPR